MRKAYILSIFLAFIVSATPSKADPPDQQYKLIFEDNFTYFNSEKWNIDTSQRHGAVNSTRGIKVEDDKLAIAPFTEAGNHYTGIVNTSGKFEFNKGYVEVKAKLNDLAGTWSVFWLYSDLVALNSEDYLNNGLEIDIFEHRLFDMNGKNISGYANHTIHWNGYGSFHKVIGTDTGNIGLNDNNFHIFGLLWDDSGLKFYIDGQETWMVSINTNKKLFLIISTEVGHLDFWTQPPPDKFPENYKSVEIDYVKVWQK